MSSLMPSLNHVLEADGRFIAPLVLHIFNIRAVARVKLIRFLLSPPLYFSLSYSAFLVLIRIFFVAISLIFFNKALFHYVFSTLFFFSIDIISLHLFILSTLSLNSYH
ncbi:hypothetical protein Pint_00490 [Pistacia integerrima]|uniref:Uncharacterized protein n=1 Tax=Pistacia integerrima TaxID=434235 RepID=A0ACC0ZHD3_9ROSI|nr:hypothetical protein Pint_00490 [Pistacia integerrima]